MNPAEYDKDTKIHDLRRETNPVTGASSVSWYTFWWLKPLFETGLKRPIDETDIYETLSTHQSSQLSYQFESYWKAEQKSSKQPSFLRVICRIYWRSILGYGAMYTIVDLLARIFQPQCLGGLVAYFAPGQQDISKEEAYSYAVGIILCSLVPVAIFHHFILYIFQIGMKIRVACCSLLYKKALRITKAAGTDGMTGQVINLLSNDVAKFDTATGFVHDIWKGLIELVVLGFFIYKQIGISGLFGIAFLLSFIPLQAWLGKKAAIYRLKTANRTDRRIQFMNEIIQGIQVIKMYAWEDSFSRMVDRIRRKEVNGIRGTLFIRAGLLSFNLVSRVAIFLSLVAYVLYGNVFTAKKVFIVTSYFNWLYSSMLHFWPLALTSVHEGLVSIRRIQDFLLLEERKYAPDRTSVLGGQGSSTVHETPVDESARGLLNTSNGYEVNKVVAAAPEGHAGSIRKMAPKSKRVINRKAVARQGIFMRNATALWDKDLLASAQDITVRAGGIKHVTLTVAKTEPCAIVGSVGSGKSTMLQVILGELELDEGRLEINGNLSYASQEPWLFEGTVKNNIVFTEDYQEKRYREVVSVCALERDFQLLPNGDQTIVGERGISLSGGQRARIGLARAIYRRADIYLLDDPLSAVDTHVGKHIFEECIMKFLKEKVCVLVTHQLQYLKDMKHVVLMNSGEVEAQGPFHTLAESGYFTTLQQPHHEGDRQRQKENNASSAVPSAEGQHTADSAQFRSTLDTDSSQTQKVDSVANNGIEYDSIVNIDINSKAETHKMTERRLSILPTPAQQQLAHQQHQSLYQPSPFSSSSMVFDGYDDSDENGGTKKRTNPSQNGTSKGDPNHLHKESQLTGRIGWRVYKSFFAAVESNLLLLMAAVLFLLAQASMSGIDYYISQWVNWEEYSSALERLRSNITELGTDGSDGTSSSNSSEALLSIPPKLEGSIFTQLSRDEYILMYAVAMLFMFALSLSRSFLFFYICLRATVRLHDRLFRGITRATMYFFNTNPSGRILNRFSRDIGCIDTFLPFAMMDCILFFVEFSAIIVLVAVVNYWLLFPTLVMAIIFYFLRHVYTNTARSIKRVEASTRSPIFSHANASFQGLSTIRAFGVEKILADEFDKHQDLNTSAWYLFLATTRAFAQWLEMVCVLYIAVVTLSFLMVEDSMSGNVGLAITQVFNLIFMCQWGMRQTAELENQMTSVERVVEYAEVDPEPSLVSIGKHKPPADWPTKGAIRFEHFSLRYSAQSNSVLRDLNMSINAGEKIGIVGRTGAGKSSIIQALFRLAVNEGIIRIDGVDIGTLGLHDLRKRISIIPQDPILFSGTLRANLDPFKQHGDDALWNALQYVELKEVVSAMEGKLDGKMADGGTNFSMGQRQLVCLARAILRNNPILILDEATANVDPETDNLIQKTIREQFERCTVLTIAHRLHTVMDSDRVLVMDAGKAIELAHPYELLQRTDGALKRLVDGMEESTAQQLTGIAYQAYGKRLTQPSSTSNGSNRAKMV
ncbi:multidrug resistance-associated protein 4-like [Anopheles arabiensis]|uniref:Multidrug resistance-associated protein lethal(2)03659 n=1 Tax=Anopheles arabiensis TaxID=7173 RepID=A0A499FTV4_ANOAR|nr:multidrug resistance-associated protein 4-like [Anopheles arabiensis]XP_040165813.1 multidrug resistance-associated protein 4-like [Anopheles arabiensis]XP_040165821.1 multidrug resistance-associated protein 4-like [Anopheles arabiensis]XP_040165829.1 multidrug resistance-associated protein 4-like [Anopheles arabiensis]XP_040165836.1 multidrug resistance-associated protein 4-like [Anopheles arabiensis]XP_040165844.1 multidrug resistance-associated protein 4-like [Anopheles arabiensis]XP_04